MDLVLDQVMEHVGDGNCGLAGWVATRVSGEPPDECARQGHGWKLRLPEQGGEDLDAHQQSIRTSRNDSDSTQKQPDEN